MDAGTALHTDALPANAVAFHYVKHRESEARPSGNTIDLGAFEYSSGSPVEVITTELPSARRGTFYRHTLQASGGSGSLVWSVSGGSLPPGLWLDESTGEIHGKAVRRGSWTFTVRAADAANAASFAERELTVSIRLFP
ncbi:MAG: putative Ig domain-containing protein [Acidobacteriota bacterium]|nr:MAG: putative Ig domain-containing protein [Acidobacteriota bacterium]